MKNKDNFYKSTQANFIETEKPITTPDFISNTGDGETPSEYWFTNNGIIRSADHWGIVQDCYWLHKGSEYVNVLKTGFCNYADFADNFTYSLNSRTLVFYNKFHIITEVFDSKFSFFIKNQPELTEQLLTTVKTKRIKETCIEYAVNGIFNLIENNLLIKKATQ